MRLFGSLSVLVLSATLVGCGFSTPVKMQQMRTYALSAITPTRQAAHHHTQKTVLITLPIPNSGFESNKLVYQPLPYDLRYYANHQWAAPPAQMLMPILAQALRNTGYFEAVVTTPFSGITSYHLDTRLVSLTQDFLHPKSREHVVLQETVSSNATSKVIASKRFAIYVPAPGNDAYSGVVAANKAVRVLSNKVAQWVKRSIS